jgi:hypothetical protein
MKRLALAAALLGLLPLAGCGTDDPAAPVEPSTTAASGSPTKAAPVEPTMPAAAAAQTKAGAIAFAKYYWALVNYAQASGQTADLRAIQHDRCAACKGGARWIDQVHAHGGTITGGVYTLGKVTAQELSLPSTSSTAFAVIVRAKTSPESITGAGKLNDRYPASSPTITMTVQQVSGAWQVTSWSMRRL